MSEKKSKFKWHTSRKRKITGGAFKRPRKKVLKLRKEPEKKKQDTT